jgi:hypothetical protein
VIAGLEPILAAALGEDATVYDLDTGPLPADGPAVWITGGTSTASVRAISGAARGYVDVARLVCVSNSAAGVLALARKVARVLDGQRVDGAVTWCPRISEPLEDRKDPTEYRWTATVDAETQAPIRRT